MKKFTFILFFTAYYGIAQNTNLSAVVLDAETKIPIPNVSIYFDQDSTNSLIGTISNEEGKFTISSVNKKLIFSHVNYDPFTLNMTSDVHEVYLTPKTYLLDEIVISNEDPKVYLARIINNSLSTFDSHTLFKGYCRESVKIKDRLTKFSDALINFYVNKGKNKSKSLFVEQSRAFYNPEIDLNNEKNPESINSVYNVHDIIAEAYSLNYLSKLIAKSKNWEYVRKIKKSNTGEEIELVELVPNPATEKLLLCGYLIINPKTQKLLEYKINYSENHIKYAKEINLFSIKFKALKFLVWVKFKEFNGKNIVTYYQKDIGFFMNFNNKFEGNNEFKNELFIYEQQPIDKLPLKIYFKTSIFESGTNFSEEYWNKYNISPFSKEELNFIENVGKLKK